MNWDRPDVETSVLDALTKTHGPISARQMVDGLKSKALTEAADNLEAIDPIEFALGTVDPITELRRMAKGESTVTATYATTRGEPGDGDTDAEPETSAQRAARDIQALHDPVVIGYVIGFHSLHLTLHPTTWEQWQDWQQRLNCPVGLTTYRGGSATAHGTWDRVPVDVTCILGQLPKPVQPGDGA